MGRWVKLHTTDESHSNYSNGVSTRSWQCFSLMANELANCTCQMHRRFEEPPIKWPGQGSNWRSLSISNYFYDWESFCSLVSMIPTIPNEQAQAYSCCRSQTESTPNFAKTSKLHYQSIQESFGKLSSLFATNTMLHIAPRKTWPSLNRELSTS